MAILLRYSLAFKQIINANLAKQLNSFLMCGNHGDPMIAKDALEMYEWLRYNNNELYILIYIKIYKLSL